MQLAEVEKISLRGSLEEGLCDVIYTRNFQEEREEGYEKVILEYDRFAAVLPEGHPLYGRDRIALEELKGEPFLLLDEQTGLLQRVRQMCRSAGFEPEIALQGKPDRDNFGHARPPAAGQGTEPAIFIPKWNSTWEKAN